MIKYKRPNRLEGFWTSGFEYSYAPPGGVLTVLLQLLLESTGTEYTQKIHLSQ